jgi:hypothetical protein
VLAAASNAYNPFEDLFGGNLPLIVLWGIYFIYKYVKKAED